MGKPGRKVIIIWKDRVMKRTERTETSKYPQEKKSTASEIGPAKKDIGRKKNILGRMTKEGDSPVFISKLCKNE